VIILTLAVVLMSFDTVRQYGVSLFASAGVVGLAVGLAARPVLSKPDRRRADRDDPAHPHRGCGAGRE
jgi:hypothetical protein